VVVTLRLHPGTPVSRVIVLNQKGTVDVVDVFYSCIDTVGWPVKSVPLVPEDSFPEKVEEEV